MIAATIFFDNRLAAWTMFCMLCDPFISFTVVIVFPLLQTDTWDWDMPIFHAIETKFLAAFAGTWKFGYLLFLKCICATGWRAPTHRLIVLWVKCQFIRELFKYDNHSRNHHLMCSFTWTKLLDIERWYLRMTSGFVTSWMTSSSSTSMPQAGSGQRIMSFTPSSAIFTDRYWSQHPLQYLWPHSKLYRFCEFSKKMCFNI